jgi:hypothetical protein
MKSRTTLCGLLCAAVAAGALASQADSTAGAATAATAVSDSSALADSSSAATRTARKSPAKNRFEKTTITVTSGAGDSSDVVVVRETQDSVYVVNTADLPVMLKKSKDKVGVLRKKGLGIGGGPTPGFYAINMGPVHDLAQRAAPLRDRQFHYGPLDYRAFYMRGGVGYIGLGNGLRIGGGGAQGSSEMTSSLYSGDSAAILSTKVHFGGLLVEKAVVLNRINGVIGGYIGGGSTEVAVKLVDMANASWFNDDGVTNINQTGDMKAEFMYLELHGGFTYTILPIFHIGLDVSAPMFLSPNGFASPLVPYSSEFFTINPGIRAKIIFGNLG